MNNRLTDIQLNYLDCFRYYRNGSEHVYILDSDLTSLIAEVRALRAENESARRVIGEYADVENWTSQHFEWRDEDRYWWRLPNVPGYSRAKRWIKDHPEGEKLVIRQYCDICEKE